MTMICLIKTHRTLLIVSFSLTFRFVIFSMMALACSLNESLSAGNNNDEKFIKTHVMFDVPSLMASQPGNDTMIRLIETHNALVIVSCSSEVISVILLIMALPSLLYENLSARNNNDDKFIKTHLVSSVTFAFMLKASLSAPGNDNHEMKYQDAQSINKIFLLRHSQVHRVPDYDLRVLAKREPLSREMTTIKSLTKTHKVLVPNVTCALKESLSARK